MTASFIILELMYRVFSPIPKNKASLIKEPESNILTQLTYYQDKIISRQKNYYASFKFFKIHFFYQIK